MHAVTVYLGPCLWHAHLGHIISFKPCDNNDIQNSKIRMIGQVTNLLRNFCCLDSATKNKLFQSHYCCQYTDAKYVAYDLSCATIYRRPLALHHMEKSLMKNLGICMILGSITLQSYLHTINAHRSLMKFLAAHWILLVTVCVQRHRYRLLRQWTCCIYHARSKITE